MSHSTQTKQWYVADIVIEIVVESDPRNVVHVNTVLVRAADNEDAYRRAFELGRRVVGRPYLNPAGKYVRSKFLGLRGLDLVHDRLTHGCEIMYEEYVRVSRRKIAAMVTKKSELNLFRRRSEQTENDRPDYSCGEIGRAYQDYVRDFKSRK